jgi:hypothetical protein
MNDARRAADPLATKARRTDPEATDSSARGETLNHDDAT